MDEKGGLHFPRYFITVLCGIPDIVIIPFISCKLIHQCDFFSLSIFIALHLGEGKPACFHDDSSDLYF